MRYIHVRNRLLRENDLCEQVRAFEQSADPVWHFRRHVLPPKFDPRPIKPGKTRIGVRLGFDLLKAWDEDCRSITSIHISVPLLIVDTEWLFGVPNAAPPEVYMCLAKDSSAFRPLLHEEAISKEFDSGTFDHGEHMAGTTVRYLADEAESDRGSWLFAVDRSAEHVEKR